MPPPREEERVEPVLRTNIVNREQSEARRWVMLGWIRDANEAFLDIIELGGAQ
jgi:hypothetical protein